MIALALLGPALLQVAAPRAPAALRASTPDSTRAVAPVLAFPEPGLDDTAAYQGYRTRLYRDAAQNTVQVYVEPRSGRVVLLWADALDESTGFTARDARGRPAMLAWYGDSAVVGDSAGTRSIAFALAARAPRVQLGWFVLGSMRVERDFQYAQRGRRPFARGAFRVAEESTLVADIAGLPAAERARHVALLSAPDVAALQARLVPAMSVSTAGGRTRVRITRPYLDGRHRLALEIEVDPRAASARIDGPTVAIASRSGSDVRFTVRVTTDAPALTPLSRDQIFDAAFLDFLANARAPHAGVRRATGDHPRGADPAAVTRWRRLEREVRGVELLSSQEKLMAGLPNFATYFGRDMLMTALMMRAIWKPEMSEHVIASALRKLGPAGDVSHEEALGGQAIREHAVVYDSLLREWRRASAREPARADSLLDAARAELRDVEVVRENYHMMDDEFQLPVLEARYLADAAVPDERKRTFLLDRADNGEPRLARLLRELALVAREASAYAREPVATNLVGFPKRDSTHWRSASWRDSDAGYANGRFAMDINAIWVPHALDATATILRELRRLGLGGVALDSIAPEVASSPLGQWSRDGEALARAIETWRGARRHFVVALAPAAMRARIQAKLAWMPGAERRFWERVMTATGEARDSLVFLALALDSAGHPIPIVNTDPATELFLESSGAAPPPMLAASADSARRRLEPFVRPYPVALFITGLGPVVSNDAYASRAIWDRFRKDPYHGPRVVWGREVNLLLLALANDVARAAADSARGAGAAGSVPVLRDALSRTLAAVRASGMEHNELWSYQIVNGRLRPVRYGTGSDVQLWSTTDLAVQFVLSRIAER